MNKQISKTILLIVFFYWNFKFQLEDSYKKKQTEMNHDESNCYV